MNTKLFGLLGEHQWFGLLGEHQLFGLLGEHQLLGLIGEHQLFGLDFFLKKKCLNIGIIRIFMNMGLISSLE